MLTENKHKQFKILLGDDRSEHAHAALALLEDLSFPPGTDVTVFRAFSPTQTTDLILMEDALNQTCNRLKENGLYATAQLQVGAPTEKFLKFAEEHKPDLIILGAQGLRASAGILVGGVAQQVVEHAPCPVLVARIPYDGLRDILMVTDGSDSSQQAIEFLGRLPLPGHIRVWVMHVLPPLPIPIIAMGMPVGWAPLPMQISEEEAGLRAKEQQEGQALVDATLAALRSMGKPAKGILKTGDAATEIMEVVRERNIDLVVTGSRGLSPIRGWLMGSVSRKLVHYLKCSVLVVRNQPVG